MKTITQIDGYRVEVEKVFRTRTQFEWFLNIYMGKSQTESLHKYPPVHLTKKSAIEEATRVIKFKKPRVERVY